MSPRPQIFYNDNPNDLAQTGAGLFEAAAASAVSERGRFVAALSGGSTPRDMHRTLAREPFCSRIDWSKTHIFWADERCVPTGQQDSNYGTARSDFLRKVVIPSAQIHPMPVDIPPEKKARQYEKELIDFFRRQTGGIPVFDLICLGMGSDGHTASLFPGHRALEEQVRLIVAVRGGHPYVSRLTMTLPLLNRARQVMVLVSGREKAGALLQVFENEALEWPIQRIRPLEGELIWLVDRQAASRLPGEAFHEPHNR